jgi:hypothetical protein
MCNDPCMTQLTWLPPVPDNRQTAPALCPTGYYSHHYQTIYDKYLGFVSKVRTAPLALEGRQCTHSIALHTGAACLSTAALTSPLSTDDLRPTVTQEQQPC